MSATVRITAAALVAVCAVSAHAQTPAAINEVIAANAIEWTAPNIGQLAAIFKDTQVVADLENQTLAPEDRDAAAPNAVGEYKILDLNNDGHLEMLCAVDATGRAFYTELVVFSQQNGKIVRADASTPGANMVNLDSRIVDLHHDGMKEILVPSLLGQYQGSKPVPELPDVYRFDRGKLVQVNHEFSSYYTKTPLPHLVTEINKMKLSHPEAKGLEIAAMRQEIEAIKHTFGE